MDKLPWIIQSLSSSSKSPPTLALLEKLSCTLYQRDQKKTTTTTRRHPGLLGHRPLWPGSRHRPQGQQPSSRGETWWLGFKVASRIIASPIITTFLRQTHSQCHRLHYFQHHPHPHHQLHRDLHHPHVNPHHDDLIWKVLRLPSAATAHPSLRESLGESWHNHNWHSKLNQHKTQLLFKSSHIQTIIIRFCRPPPFPCEHELPRKVEV